MPTYARVPMLVKCDACQGELSTTEEGLRLGRRSKCPKCSADLRPTHDDPACDFCKGEGMVRVGRAMSICRSDS